VTKTIGDAKYDVGVKETKQVRARHRTCNASKEAFALVDVLGRGLGSANAKIHLPGRLRAGWRSQLNMDIHVTHSCRLSASKANSQTKPTKPFTWTCLARIHQNLDIVPARRSK
jgi:hypothetical protein